jgi:aminocarboxymuconate-semialdehyde decarboxylase
MHFRKNKVGILGQFKAKIGFMVDRSKRIDMHSHFYGGGIVEKLRERTARPFLRMRDDGVEVMVAMNGEFPFLPAYHNYRVGLAQMDAIGLTHRMVTFPGALCLDILPVEEIATTISNYNSYLADLNKETKGRIIGLGGVSLADMTLAANELKRIRHELKLPGIIIPSGYFNTIDDAKSLEPLFDVANETSALVMVHPGPKVGAVPDPLASDYPQYRTSVIALQSQISQATLTLILSGIIDRFPKIRFQMVNLGGTLPFVFERIESVSRHRSPDNIFPFHKLKNIWYDCASLGPRALEAAVALYGADRVMMGSDWPIFHDDPWAIAVEPSTLSEDEKYMVESNTAVTLLEEIGCL